MKSHISQASKTSFNAGSFSAAEDVLSDIGVDPTGSTVVGLNKQAASETMVMKRAPLTERLRLQTSTTLREVSFGDALRAIKDELLHFRKGYPIRAAVIPSKGVKSEELKRQILNLDGTKLPDNRTVRVEQLLGANARTILDIAKQIDRVRAQLELGVTVNLSITSEKVAKHAYLRILELLSENPAYHKQLKIRVHGSEEQKQRILAQMPRFHKLSEFRDKLRSIEGRLANGENVRVRVASQSIAQNFGEKLLQLKRAYRSQLQIELSGDWMQKRDLVASLPGFRLNKRTVPIAVAELPKPIENPMIVPNEERSLLNKVGSATGSFLTRVAAGTKRLWPFGKH